MSWDIKQHEVTGDWLFSANHDFQSTVGEGLVAQRLRNRLRIKQGTYLNYPSFGSRLYDLLRATMRHPIAGGEIEAIIREALEPMVDIQVNDVSVEEDEVDPGRLNVVINYQPVLAPEDGFVPDVELQEFSEAFSIDEILEPTGEEASI